VTADPRTLRDAALRKSEESVLTTRRFFVEHADRVAACAADVARAFDRGGRLFAFGNGGSACDAEHLAVEFSHPIVEKRRALPAVSLGADRAFSSAVGNDEDFSLGYAKELRLHARPGDVAVGMSTSGKSRNVLRALKAAREIGALTIGFAGRDGGAIREACDHAFVVPSFSIHRIQEVHVALLHVLWDLVHLELGEADVL